MGEFVNEFIDLGKQLWPWPDGTPVTCRLVYVVGDERIWATHAEVLAEWDAELRSDPLSVQWSEHKGGALPSTRSWWDPKRFRILVQTLDGDVVINVAVEGLCRYLQGGDLLKVSPGVEVRLW